MARAAITPQAVVAIVCTLGANIKDIVWTAADVALGNKAVSTGRELVLVWNTHETDPGTVKFTSVPDGIGRTGDTGDYSLAAGEIGMFWVSPQVMWKDTSDGILINASAATMKVAVLVIP